MRRFATATGLLALVAAVALFAWVGSNLTDAPDAGDADLALVLDARPEPADDVFAGLGEIADEIALSDEQAAVVTSFLQTGQDSADLEPILVGHRKLRPRLAEVLSRPVSRAELPDLGGEPDPARMLRMKRLQQLSHLLLAEARLAAGRGGCEAAFDALAQGFLLASRLRRTQGADLVLFMTAMHQLGAAVDTGNGMLRPCAPSPAWRDWARRDADPPGNAAWADAVRLEYQVMKAAVQSIDPLQGTPGEGLPARGWLPVEYVLQKNRTLAAMAVPYRVVAAGRCDAPPGLPDEPKPAPWIGLLPNGMGRILAAIARPDYARYLGRWCEARTRYQVHRTLVALRAYRDAHGALPATLDALVPDSLVAVPLDPSTGAPLAYAAEARTVAGVAIPF